jgi:hypothetical protein
MFNSICTEKGITLIEALLAVCLTTIGIMALLSLFSTSWRLAGTSDSLGKASGILFQQMGIQQNRILNPNTSVAAGTTTATVYPSGQVVPTPGETPFTARTSLTDLGGGSAWLVRVRVTWPGNGTGISESLRVTRQEKFRQ